MRKLMPSLYRFRILDAEGKDVSETELGASNDSIRVECREDVNEYCVKPLAHRYYREEQHIAL